MVTGIVVSLGLLNGFKVFDIIFVMTGGGPNHASEVFGTYLYSLAFGSTSGSLPQFGYASAFSVVVMIMCILAVVAQMAVNQEGRPMTATEPRLRPGRRGPFTDPVRRRRSRPPIGKVFATFVLLPICALMLFPFVWLVLTSLREQNTVFSGPFIPRNRSRWTAYRTAWTSIEFPLHFWNSLWITTVTVIGVLVFATLSGYAFAKLDFPFKNALYVLLLTTLMMPATALIIPLYLELKSLGLLNTQAGLLVLYICGSAPFSMFLMRAFFQTLPDELVEAARVDGSSEFTIFFRVILPLARPGIATVVIFQFLQTWNEFLMANTVLQNTELLPLQPVLFSLTGQYQTDWPTLTAGLTLSIIPVIIVYVRMQNQFVAGMTLGAVK